MTSGAAYFGNHKAGPIQRLGPDFPHFAKAKRHRWKTHDVYDRFRSIERGNLPLVCPTNEDLTEAGDSEFPVQKLDVNWPDGIGGVNYGMDNLLELKTAIDEERPEEIDMYKIDNDIPAIPKATGRPTSGQAKEIFDTMDALEVGQSFFIPIADQTLDRVNHLRNGIQTRVAQYKKVINQTGDLKYFITRSYEQDGKKGLRIWRVATKNGLPT